MQLRNRERMVSRRVRAGVVGVVIAVASLAGSSTAQAEITTTGYYAVTYSDTIFRYVSTSASGGFQYPITYQEWQRDGFPPPVPVRSEVVKYAWSPTLYAVTFFRGDWEWQRLTYEQWERMGFQGPYDAGWIDGSYIFRYGSSTELFLDGEDGSLHKLTYDEWAATGFQPAVDWNLDIGFVQPRGSSAIFIVYNYGTNNESSFQLTYESWLGYGSPTPQVR